MSPAPAQKAAPDVDTLVNQLSKLNAARTVFLMDEDNLDRQLRQKREHLVDVEAKIAEAKELLRQALTES